MSRFAVILAAAGQSSRFTGFRRKKPFVDLKGRAVWLRAAEHFLKRPDVCQTVLVVAPGDMDWFKEHFQANLAFMDVSVIAGGATRAESIRRGLDAVGSDATYVAVHDAARPLLTDKWIDSLFTAALKYQAVIPGIPVTSTVKRVTGDGVIESTVDRSRLVLAQTPQVFERKLLEKAYAACRNFQAATDDASLVEQIGQPVHVIDGWPMNIKITTADDFRLAELFLNALPRNSGLSGLHPFQDDKVW